jgi:hypothetical protein
MCPTLITVVKVLIGFIALSGAIVLAAVMNNRPSGE